MAGWTPDLSGIGGPKYTAIVEALSEAIKRGDLRSGERLPSQRQLAARLGFDLTTITRAYDLAQKRGLVVAKGPTGSFVRETAKASIAAGVQVDTGMNTPPVPPGEVLQRAISLGLHSVLQTGDVSDFQYQGTGGSGTARRAGSLLMSRIGLPTEADQIVVTAGGQNGLHAVMSAAIKPGDRIACGSFAYPGFRAIARRMGIELVALPQMTAAALQAACSEGPISALYVVPTNDNPTTATVPSEERQLLADVIQQNDISLIEDDAYGLLPSEPLPAISSFVPERSWYLLSTSKIISPALRVAFVRTPSVAHALRTSADVHETAVMAPPLNAAVVATWVRDGTFDRLVAAIRGEAAWRMKLALRILDDKNLAFDPLGYHLWLRLPTGARANEISHALALAGIGTVPSSRFAITSTAEQALRVSLGGVARSETLEFALYALQGHLTASLDRWQAVV